MSSYFRRFKHLSKLRKIQVGSVIGLLIILTVMLIYFVVHPSAATLGVSNTASVSYIENGVSKSAQSNTVSTTILTPPPLPLPIISPTPTNPPQITVTQSPAKPRRSQWVYLTATVTNDPNHLVTAINIYVDNVSVKTCSGVTSCTYMKKYSIGNHTYYATTTGVSLRNPLNGSYSFTVTK